MDTSTIADFITKLGLPVALVLYYVYKDWKFTQQLIEALTRNTMLLGSIAEKIGIVVPDNTKEAAD